MADHYADGLKDNNACHQYLTTHRPVPYGFVLSKAHTRFDTSIFSLNHFFHSCTHIVATRAHEVRHNLNIMMIMLFQAFVYSCRLLRKGKKYFYILSFLVSLLVEVLRLSTRPLSCFPCYTVFVSGILQFVQQYSISSSPCPLEERLNTKIVQFLERP